MGPDAHADADPSPQRSLGFGQRRHMLHKSVWQISLVSTFRITILKPRSVVSTFFGLGQTLPTYRHGVGIFQPALDDAIKLLSQENAWLHVFPEGRVRQSKDLSSTSSLFPMQEEASILDSD